MKHTRLYLVAVGFFYLTACNSGILTDTTDLEQPCLVQFQLHAAPEILPFHVSKSIPSGNPPEPNPSTPGGGTDVSRLFTTLEYAIYDETTNQQIKYEQLTGGDDFGTYIYDKFDKGTYKICLLAHSAKKVSYANNCITIGEVGDTFFASLTLVIENSNDQKVDLMLKRVVSRVEFKPTDNIPANASALRLRVSGLFNTFNLFNGAVDQTAPKDSTITHVFTEAEKQSQTYNASFMSLVPTTGPAIKQVVLETMQGENVINMQTIKEIPLYANKTVRFTGALFTTSASGTINITIDNNGLWGPDVEYTPTK